MWWKLLKTADGEGGVTCDGACSVFGPSAHWLWRRRLTLCMTPLTRCRRTTGWRRPARGTLCWDRLVRLRWKTASCKKPQEKKQNNTPFMGFFCFFWLTCLKKKKGNMTKVECSTTETESFLYLHCALNMFCYFLSFSITLSTSETSEHQKGRIWQFYWETLV